MALPAALLALLSTVLSTFGIIFLAELPDKTALASLLMATRYRPVDVVVGGWLAFLIQTLVAVAAGGLMGMLPAEPVRIAAGAGFLIFAFFAWRRKDDAEEPEVGERPARGSRLPGWAATFVVVFAAEWGDLTQLATAALAAHSRDVLSVSIGAVAALWTVTLIAALAGKQLSRLVSSGTLNRVSGLLFAVVGVAIIVSAVV